ncbi:MAG: hemolysin family protein [Methanoregulaceae archaeon]|nr:hemolysin family protein [Methanoregulaceae archaeon]
MSITYELVLIAILILLNGLLVMAEFAIVAAKKSRLQHKAEQGDKQAADALSLAEEPTNFLSTIQVGITLISIVIGAFGGAAIAESLALIFQGFPPLAPYSEALALTTVVIVVTYFTLLFGEIIPKWIGMNDAERIASRVARPVRLLSWAMYPVVIFLSYSTEAVLRGFRLKKGTQPPITEEEIKILIEQGAEAGIFEEAEADMVEGIFNLADQKAGRFMVLRPDIVALDINDTPEKTWIKMVESRRSYFPVYRDELDNFLGIVAIRDLWVQVVEEKPMDIESVITTPLFVPESVPLLKLLDYFRKEGLHIAMVVDELGNIQGLITLHDILEAIVGHLPTADEPVEAEIILRADGSWLMDGSVTVDDFRETIGVEIRPDEQADRFHTLAGFVMLQLQRIPKTGDRFEWNGFSFEVVDMDGMKIDKVLVSRMPTGDKTEKV